VSLSQTVTSKVCGLPLKRLALVFRITGRKRGRFGLRYLSMRAVRADKLPVVKYLCGNRGVPLVADMPDDEVGTMLPFSLCQSPMSSPSSPSVLHTHAPIHDSNSPVCPDLTLPRLYNLHSPVFPPQLSLLPTRTPSISLFISPAPSLCAQPMVL